MRLERLTRRDGFALLAALWLVVALTVVGGAAMTVARTGAAATRNRVLLARAGWARDACAEILQARFAADSNVRDLGPVDLGRATWCRARLEDPAAKLNVNTAPRELLAGVLCVPLPGRCDADALARAVIAARRQAPFSDVRRLAAVAGFDSSRVARLDAWLTTRGTGVVNLNAAPASLLRVLPGMGSEAVGVLLARRTRVDAPRTLDHLAGLLTPSGRQLLLAHYGDLTALVVFAPVQFVATIEGGVRDTPIVARAVLTLVPVSGRLAVMRRVVE